MIIIAITITVTITITITITTILLVTIIIIIIISSSSSSSSSSERRMETMPRQVVASAWRGDRHLWVHVVDVRVASGQVRDPLVVQGVATHASSSSGTSASGATSDQGQAEPEPNQQKFSGCKAGPRLLEELLAAHVDSLVEAADHDGVEEPNLTDFVHPPVDLHPITHVVRVLTKEEQKRLKPAGSGRGFTVLVSLSSLAHNA